MRYSLSRLLLSLALLSPLVTMVACDTGDEWDAESYSEPIPDHLMVQAQVSGPLPPGIPLPLYSLDSPWNQPIPAGAAIDPDSETMIALLVEDAENENHPPSLSVREWSVTVYLADENTPRYDIPLTATWSPYDVLLDVPIPDGALPDPEDDGHMTILDLSTGYEYDFWIVSQRRDGSWRARWGNRISLDSSGTYANGMSARGSGFASLAGMIWPEEFEQGHIDHALVVSIPHAAAGGPVWPATESDGWSHAPGAIPEGVRLQLDPALDLAQFSMLPYERIIAEALQTYGAFVGDNSGSIEFEVINPISYLEDPYPPDWFDSRWALLSNIPWEHMRVLELPPQDPDPLLIVTDETIYIP
jgi:hypothetical protein